VSDDANPHGIPRMMHHRAYSEQSQAKGRPHLNALSGDALEAFRTKATPVSGSGNDPKGMQRPTLPSGYDVEVDDGLDVPDFVKPKSRQEIIDGIKGNTHTKKSCGCEGGSCNCG
jgi:hypothetical protein